MRCARTKSGVVKRQGAVVMGGELARHVRWGGAMWLPGRLYGCLSDRLRSDGQGWGRHSGGMLYR